MSLSLYQASVPVFVRMFGNLSAILDKAAAYAEARKIDPAVLLNARLAPDMHPLTRQIQIASDAVKGCAARLAGVEVPSFADSESSFAELQARIAKTLEFVNSLTPAQKQALRKSAWQKKRAELDAMEAVGQRDESYVLPY